jgi:O-methyltransferase
MGIRSYLSIILRALKGRDVFIPFSPTYNEDGLINNKNVGFLLDARFRDAVDRAIADELYVDPNIRWRCHVACWAATHALKLGGDFVECGVNKGFMSRILMDYVGFAAQPRKFYLLDTFGGFEDHGRRYEDCYETARKAFRGYHNAVLVKGEIPSTLGCVQSAIAYLAIDMNSPEPERAAIEYFWPKMVSGGIVLLDDYCWPTREKQKDSMDEFAKSVGAQILSLPTGQGMILRP